MNYFSANPRNRSTFQNPKISVWLNLQKGYQPLLKNLVSARILGACLVLWGCGCGICLAMIIISTFSARYVLPQQSSDPQALLDRAKGDLDNTQPQKVLDALKPNMDQFSEDEERAVAYEYLGQAEIQLGHFQFAAMYFENMYALQPTAEHLYMLATAYDAGGDLRHALKNYKTLAELNTANAAIYHSLAEQRITQLEEILNPKPNSNP